MQIIKTGIALVLLAGALTACKPQETATPQPAERLPFIGQIPMPLPFNNFSAHMDDGDVLHVLSLFKGRQLPNWQTLDQQFEDSLAKYQNTTLAKLNIIKYLGAYHMFNEHLRKQSSPEAKEATLKYARYYLEAGGNSAYLAGMMLQRLDGHLPDEQLKLLAKKYIDAVYKHDTQYLKDVAEPDNAPYSHTNYMEKQALGLAVLIQYAQ